MAHSRSELALSDGAWVRPIGVAILVMAALNLWILVVGPLYEPHVTDLGRDLIGAKAVDQGLSPYRPLGELRAQIRGVEFSEEADHWWVAHTPASIAGTGLLQKMAGDSAESAFAWLTVLGTGLMAGLLGVIVGRSLGAWCGLGVAGSVLICFAVVHDILWLHGGAVAGCFLIAVYQLDDSRSRWGSLVLLGGLVAWKPWLAPLAAFLPCRKALSVDLGVVGGTAVALNLLGAASMGGMAVWQDWVRLALPANFAELEFADWNLSIAANLLNPTATTVTFLLLAIGLLTLCRFVPRAQWPLLGVLSIVIASPLVWPQYWLTLLVPIVLGFRRKAFAALLLVLLSLSVVVAPVLGGMPKVRALMAIVLIVVEVIRSAIEYRSSETDVVVEENLGNTLKA